MFLCVLALMARASSAAEEKDFRPVLAALRAEVEARPSRVLIAVEDALTMNERAACEITKEAIRITGADARLVGEITGAALRHTPAMSAVIVECAVASAPEAVKEIQMAVEQALGKPGDVPEGSGKSPPDAGEKAPAASGKETSAKGPGFPAAAEEEYFEWFQPASVGVGGIYLMMPSRSSWFTCPPDDLCCSGELSVSCLRP